MTHLGGTELPKIITFLCVAQGQVQTGPLASLWGWCGAEHPGPIVSEHGSLCPSPGRTFHEASFSPRKQGRHFPSVPDSGLGTKAHTLIEYSDTFCLLPPKPNPDFIHLKMGGLWGSDPMASRKMAVG